MSAAQVAGGHKGALTLPRRHPLTPRSQHQQVRLVVMRAAADGRSPNTSEESKEHSRQVLEGGLQEEGEAAKASKSTEDKNVAGGLKATLKNPNVSEEAKESAKQRLDEMGASA